MRGKISIWTLEKECHISSNMVLLKIMLNLWLNSSSAAKVLVFENSIVLHALQESLQKCGICCLSEFLCILFSLCCTFASFAFYLTSFSCFLFMLLLSPLQSLARSTVYLNFTIFHCSFYY